MSELAIWAMIVFALVIGGLVFERLVRADAYDQPLKPFPGCVECGGSGTVWTVVTNSFGERALGERVECPTCREAQDGGL